MTNKRTMGAKGRAKAKAIWGAASNMAARGEAITYRKLADAMGLGSVGDIKTYLDALEHLGYITRGPERSKGTLSVTVPLVTL